MQLKNGFSHKKFLQCLRWSIKIAVRKTHSSTKVKMRRWFARPTEVRLRSIRGVAPPIHITFRSLNWLSQTIRISDLEVQCAFLNFLLIFEKCAIFQNPSSIGTISPFSKSIATIWPITNVSPPTVSNRAIRLRSNCMFIFHLKSKPFTKKFMRRKGPTCVCNAKLKRGRVRILLGNSINTS